MVACCSFVIFLQEGSENGLLPSWRWHPSPMVAFVVALSLAKRNGLSESMHRLENHGDGTNHLRPLQAILGNGSRRPSFIIKACIFERLKRET